MATKVNTIETEVKSKFVLSLEASLRYNWGQCQELAAALNGTGKRSPEQALSNCDDVFLSAARIQVCTDVMDTLANAASKESEAERAAGMIEYFRKEIVNMAGAPRKSTSVTSNLSHQYKLAAEAEMLESLLRFYPEGEKK